MATQLYRLGRTAFRRWPAFLAVWLLLLVGVGAFAATMSKPLSDEFSIPGIPSERAADLQAELFPGSVDAFSQAGVTVVVQAPEGERLDDPQNRAAVDALIADLSALPQLPEPVEGQPLMSNPVDAAAGLTDQLVQAATEAGGDVEAARADAEALSPLSADGRTGLITFAFDVDSPTAVEPETRDAVVEAMEANRDSGLAIEANGAGMQNTAPPDATAEAIGIGVALVVLVLTFGSLVAAGLPIITAVIGIALAGAGVTSLTAFTDVGSSTPILATMIGLAVGIDYALFILARYRSELHRSDSREEAVGRAVGTAGSAVVFAGLTVVIALVALAVVRIPFLTSMGLAAAAAVVIAVLIALTLVPAVLGMLKSKAFGGQVIKFHPKHDEQGRLVNNGARWATAVGRAPIAVVLVVVVALSALALPLSGLRLAFPTDSTAPADTTQRKASDLVTEAFGAGREAPLLLVADGRGLPAEDRQAAYGEVVAWASGQTDVANAQIVAQNEDGTGAQILVTPESGPDEKSTQTLLEDLRAGQDQISEDTGLALGVTGLTAITTDISDRLFGALPVYLAVVIGLAFLLLMIVFRSVLVPLTATLGFLLSVLATLGATVAVFSEGLFGWFDPQPLVSFMPIFLIGVVFGLAMDYQVFLITRVREAHVHGDTAPEAIVDGFRNSARVVAAAAVIMISVFAGFILMDDPVIKSMGFALAVAVFLDAFVVRMTLIPAVLYLLGERAWTLPGWLDRLLPKVDVEGEALLAARHDHDRAPGEKDLAGDGDEDPLYAGV